MQGSMDKKMSGNLGEIAYVARGGRFASNCDRTDRTRTASDFDEHGCG